MRQQFPHTLSEGYTYIILWYHYHKNEVFIKLLKNRTEDDINRSLKKIQDKLTAHGYTLKSHQIDNECLVGLKYVMKDIYLEYQLVPPHICKQNLAKQAIIMFKENFTRHTSISPKYPMHLWYMLLKHVEMTLKVMQ